MKILVINPIVGNPEKKMGNYLNSICGRNTEIIIRNLTRGPEAIEKFSDEILAGESILKIAMEKAHQVDGIVLNCFFDPCLTALREALQIPVVGVAESSIFTALISSNRVGVIAPLAISKPITEKQFRAWGIEEKLTEVFTFPLEVKDLNPPKEDVWDLLTKGVKILENKGAEAIILGCTELYSYYKDLQAKSKIEVIEPLATAIKVTEILVKLKLSHPGIKIYEDSFFYNNLIKKVRTF